MAVGHKDRQLGLTMDLWYREDLVVGKRIGSWDYISALQAPSHLHSTYFREP